MIQICSVYVFLSICSGWKVKWSRIDKEKNLQLFLRKYQGVTVNVRKKGSGIFTFQHKKTDKTEERKINRDERRKDCHLETRRILYVRYQLI